MATDLELAVATLNSKQTPYTTAWSYYDGAQPLRYSTAKLNEIFNNIEVRFTENWIAVVVDALSERMELERLDVLREGSEDIDEGLSKRLNQLWTLTEMDGDEEDIETAMLVTGESYAVAWQDDGDEIQAHYHDPRNAHVFYEPDNPKEKRFAVKWWEDEDKHMRLTLYYPGTLEYYRSTSKADNLGSILSGKSFVLLDTAENPHGMIPVFHWQYTKRRIKSAIANLVEPQDAINKLLNDMMIAAEFGALPQRYVITNADLGNLKSRPNEIWELPPGDGIGQQTSAGQFEANPLANFIEAINKLALYVAIESGLPKHYFLDQGGDPSGESLIAAESRLNKRATLITKKRLMPPYRELASFLLFLDGVAVDKNRIMPVFTKPETVQPKTRADIATALAGSFNAEGAADVAGYTEAEVQKLVQIETFGANGDTPR